jgi:hypothetical protein
MRYRPASGPSPFLNFESGILNLSPSANCPSPTRLLNPLRMGGKIGTFSSMRRARLQNVLFLLLLLDCFCPEYGRGEQPYHSVRRGPVVLYFQKADRFFAESAAKTIQKAMPDVMTEVGLSDPGEIHVVVAESEAVFRRLTSGSIPDWGVGAADPGSGFIFLKSPRIAEFDPDEKEIVVHELTHVMLGKAMAGYLAPRWFDEGLAQRMSGERQFSPSIRLARAFASGQVIWLDQIDDVLMFQKERAALAYETAHSALNYLVQNFGEDRIREIVRALAAGHSMDEAMQSAIGRTQGEFDSAWYETMRKRTRWAVFVDFPVLFSAALVILLALAFWRTQVRVRAKKRLWEQESDFEIEPMENDPASR